MGIELNRTIYTIGHSNHTIEVFLRLLQQYDIDCVCDVRSRPYSRFARQFNYEGLKETLRAHHILYLFFGKEFGARREEEHLYTDGIVDFSKVAQDDTFLSGIKRIETGVEKGYKIALMCTEKDPLDCHRTILVARNIFSLGINIGHILPNASLKTHDEIEKDLVAKYCSDKKQLSLFEAYEPKDLLYMAYKKANRKIGYRKSTMD